VKSRGFASPGRPGFAFSIQSPQATWLGAIVGVRSETPHDPTAARLQALGSDGPVGRRNGSMADPIRVNQTRPDRYRLPLTASSGGTRSLIVNTGVAKKPPSAVEARRQPVQRWLHGEQRRLSGDQPWGIRVSRGVWRNRDPRTPQAPLEHRTRRYSFGTSGSPTRLGCPKRPGVTYGGLAAGGWIGPSRARGLFPSLFAWVAATWFAWLTATWGPRIDWVA
jgi:hypothetical protein